MTVEVVIPWQGHCPHRLAALAWVRARYEQTGWPVTVAELPAGPWVKAAAVNPAVQASTADVVVVADGDCWSNDVIEAAAAVDAGKRPWACPFHRIRRLNRQFTERVLAGLVDVGDHTSSSLEEPVYLARPGGGIVVMARDVARDVPMDPRFVGWGGEDVSWGKALQSLHGKPWMGATDLYHLWHPAQQRPARHTLPSDAERLRQRYWDVARQRGGIEGLMDEVRALGGG